MKFTAHIVALPVRLYRLLFSPWIGNSCRFQPTCSAYALEALEKHGAIKGAWLAAKRVGRCQPFGSDGYDPVPDPHKGPRGPHDCGHDH
jgi:putative membrane protein insertion efficiency factor